MCSGIGRTKSLRFDQKELIALDILISVAKSSADYN